MRIGKNWKHNPKLFVADTNLWNVGIFFNRWMFKDF